MHLIVRGRGSLIKNDFFEVAENGQLKTASRN
jgi:hypothetical protein